MRVIDGIQFFDAEQQFLKLYEYEQDHEQQKKLTASSVVTYLLMRSQCDEAGLIYESEFNLKLVCEKLGLPYSSIHNGYHRLFEIGLLAITRIGERTYIQLPMVAAHVPNKEDNEISSYFRIPNSIFNGTFLNTFIKARDVRGLLGVFDLLNGLFREYSNKRNTTLKRKKETLIKKLKQSKYAFKNWIRRVFTSKESLIEIKLEHEDMYELKFAEAAFTDREQDVVYEKFNAAVRNTLSSLLKSSSIRYSTKELKDMQFACQQELTAPLYRAILVNDQAEKFASLVVPDVISNTIRKMENSNARVLGAYFRRTIKSQIQEVMKEEIPLRILIANTYRDEGIEVPVQFL